MKNLYEFSHIKIANRITNNNKNIPVDRGAGLESSDGTSDKARKSANLYRSHHN